MAAPGACKGGYKPPVEIWAAVRRPRGFCSRRGLVQPGCTPRFLFRLAEKKTGRARSKRKGRLDALRCSDPPRATGVGVSVPAPIWTGLRARYALLRFLLLPSRGGWRRPRRGGCRMELLLFSLPLTLPRRSRQRLAKRKAQKEKLVECILAPRRCRHHPPRDSSHDLAEDDSVPEGKPKSALAPIRRPPSAQRRECAGVRQKRPFLLDRALPSHPHG